MPDNRAEFIIMKSNPKQLYNNYIEQMQNGIPLSDDQLVKFEYLKKLLLIEE
jgi:hypothetical protein